MLAASGVTRLRRFRIGPSFQASFRCQDLLSLGEGCKSARQGSFRSTFCSTGFSKPTDKGCSDQLSARQGRQSHPTGTVQISFLLGRILKTIRLGPFRSTSVRVLKPPERRRSDQLSARLGLQTARARTVRLWPFRSLYWSTGCSKPPDWERSDQPSARHGSQNRPTARACDCCQSLLAAYLRSYLPQRSDLLKAPKHADRIFIYDQINKAQRSTFTSVAV